jgi:hypothetical protein
MVQEDVRTLCGVAQSNPKAFPSKFVACFAIALGKLYAILKVTSWGSSSNVSSQLEIDSVQEKISFNCAKSYYRLKRHMAFHLRQHYISSKKLGDGTAAERFAADPNAIIDVLAFCIELTWSVLDCTFRDCMR